MAKRTPGNLLTQVVCNSLLCGQAHYSSLLCPSAALNAGVIKWKGRLSKSPTVCLTSQSVRQWSWRRCECHWLLCLNDVHHLTWPQCSPAVRANGPLQVISLLSIPPVLVGSVFVVRGRDWVSYKTYFVVLLISKTFFDNERKICFNDVKETILWTTKLEI